MSSMSESSVNSELMDLSISLQIERDRLKAMNAELVEALCMSAAALRHALAVMPVYSEFYEHTERAEESARKALSKHKNEVAA